MKILIVKIGAIGDVIMALSIVPVLRKKYPDAEIYWLCGKTAAPVLHLVKGINHIIEINDSKILTGNFFSKISEMARIWKKMIFQKFDLIVNAHADPRYKLLYLPATKRDVYALNRNSTQRIRPVPGRHHSDEYAMLAENYDGQNDAKYDLPDLKPFSSDKITAELKTSSRVIVLAPGGAKNILRDDNLRRWPIECFVQLAEELLKLGHQVIITGSQTDKWVASHFAATPIINLIGELGIKDLVAVYSSCDLLVTHDSGPLHFSGLAGIPVVALFGPTNPYEKVPRNEYNQIIWGGRDLSCRPCYDGRIYAQCDNNICMKNIKVEKVLQSINEILNSLPKK